MANKTLTADDKTPSDLFHAAVVYEIPYFQRAYVWNEPDQWLPLWEDIETQAESYLNLKRADSLPIPHFMGALVLQEPKAPSSGSSISKPVVVDGQQRLTTTQILLAAIGDVMQKKCSETTISPQKENYKAFAKRIQNLLENGEEHTRGDARLKLKISPSKADRNAFKIIMENNFSGSTSNHPLEQAYHWFHKQAWDYLTADESKNSDLRAEALEWVATKGIQFVEIDIDRNIDANKIFDSLNSRGTQLLTADQAKNLMYWKVYNEEKQNEELTEERMRRIWPFDEDGNRSDTNEGHGRWWYQELKIGRLKIPLEAFLRDWLTLRDGQEVKTKDVMNRFKNCLDNNKMNDIGEDLRKNAKFYEGILTGNAEQDSFLFRWQHALQATPMLPVLLKLRQCTDDQKRETAERYLESYGVRRWICQHNSAGQRNAMVALLQRLEKAGVENADRVVKEFLKEQLERSRVWPEDQMVEKALLEEPILRSRNTHMTKMILLAIEQHIQSYKSEKKILLWNDLQIEHLWPQDGEKIWGRLSDPRLLEQVGNLTLVSDKLNPAMSNSEWSKKRDALKKHSKLTLNEELLKHQGPWDETAIQERSKRLAEMVMEIWPRPSTEA